MRPNLRSIAILVVAFALAACGHHADATAKASAPPLLIDSKGFTMPLSQVVTKINYRPYVPPRQILAFAVIPPLGGDDTPENRGVAIEYPSHGIAWLLSQWPKQQFAIAFGSTNLSVKPCAVAHYDTSALGWSSARGFVMTLQADGPAKPADVDAEAKNLIAAGACR
jgi:hypothetical protein